MENEKKIKGRFRSAREMDEKQEHDKVAAHLKEREVQPVEFCEADGKLRMNEMKNEIIDEDHKSDTSDRKNSNPNVHKERTEAQRGRKHEDGEVPQIDQP